MVEVRIGIEKEHPDDEKHQNDDVFITQEFENRMFVGEFFYRIFQNLMFIVFYLSFTTASLNRRFGLFIVFTVFTPVL